ncbi:MAG TPA: T9SS type A sorting domain-containing protein [Lutibacter sp.]|nr:T9SS type A sorting domain-containing protein [Lutibacter sp.]
MKTITFFIALLLSITTFAQWTTETDVNTLVTDHTSNDMKAISTSDGYTYVVYWKETDLELRLQVLDLNGNKLLGSNGSLITNTIPMNSYTVYWSTVVDKDDNLYVGVTATGDSTGYVFKLDIDGNHLWGTNGVALGSAYLPTVLPLESGEAIISWIPGNQSFMQKYDTDGNPVWNNPQEVVSGSSKTAPANLFELSNGDYILVFHSYFTGVSSTLYAQRYNSDGDAQWASPTQLSDKSTAYNKYYSGLQIDDTIYFGYYASTSTRFDSFLQRINEDGSLPWGINGIDFDIEETDNELDTSIAYQAGSQYIWAICNMANGNQAEIGEYVQKFDKDTGARQFSEYAKELYPISTEHNKHTSSLYIIENKPFFVVSKGNDDGVSPTLLEAVMLDNDGDFLWAEESKAFASFSANKKRTHLLKPTNGQAVVVFVENKASGLNIYAQNFMDPDLVLATDKYNTDHTPVVFPNPSKGVFNFKFDNSIMEDVQIAIYNSVGNLVFFTDTINTEENSIKLDLRKLPFGSYFYQINGVHFNTNGKILILK